ncbi:MAG: SEC-C domain-containing protein [Myxococcales bacterium]|nr:SEC-C domain-containing protein [Myxococcales bacterium]
MASEHLKSLSRNAECWCGSGKKYKKCHLEADEAEARKAAAAVAAQADPVAARQAEAMRPAEPFKFTQSHAVLILLSLAAGGAVTVWRGFGDGLIGALAVFITGIGYLILRDPPPPREDAGDPAALGFGTPSEAPPVETQTRPRNVSNPNPRARRRR